MHQANGSDLGSVGRSNASSVEWNVHSNCDHLYSDFAQWSEIGIVVLIPDRLSKNAYSLKGALVLGWYTDWELSAEHQVGSELH